MEVTIVPAEGTEACERAHAIIATIRTFKGRKNVDIHLFRHNINVEDGTPLPWDALIGDPVDPDQPGNPDDVKKMVLEMFTEAERDQIVQYLKNKYGQRLASVTCASVEYPVPLGVTPLSTIPEGKTMGFIRFDDVDNYSLPFAFRGFYDLAEHEPLVQPRETL